MYTPHTPSDVDSMLEAIGVSSLEALVAVPDELAVRSPLEVAPALPESEIARAFEAFARRNDAVGMTSFLGAGVYRHYAPPVIPALSMRGEFLTSYTPYQAEVSQGYLQAIYEWQTYICLLTGLEVANASVYDGATALAEGAIMAVNATGRRSLLVSRAIHPNYRAVLKTYCDGLDIAIDEIPYAADGTTAASALSEQVESKAYAAVAVQSPNFFGVVDAFSPEAVAAIKASGTLAIGVVAEAMSLGVLAEPSSWGVDICVGEAQSFGVAQAYGGPHVGFIACTQEHLRRIPGRLVGRTLDAHGADAFVLTLQAREQHIRREKATSNICTNQAHCALTATIYLAAMGASGLRDCATANCAAVHDLTQAVTSVAGIERRFSAPVFNEVVVRVGARAAGVLESLRSRGILGGVDLGRYYPELADCILMAATELTTSEDIATLRAALGHVAISPRSADLAAAR